MTLARSAAHRIVATMHDALKRLGLDVALLDVERWGVSVHEALASRAREFHTHHHVLALVEGTDPLEALSALYHDVVYVHVDLDVPARFETLLTPLLRRETEGNWRIMEAAHQDEASRDVLSVFGRSVADIVNARNGVNELASALVAVKELQNALPRVDRIGIAACIEATIPFRTGVGDQLAARLTAMALPGLDVRQTVIRAIRMANRDVGNFALDDAAHFLDNTWKLLPETNPTLHTPTVYGMRDYRVALQKMEGFLSTLPAERVFQWWATEPEPEVHQRRVAAAARNIAIAGRYLRCKLYSVAILEALAEVTGGDAPLDYFMGGLPDQGGPPMKRLERFLPKEPEADVPLEPNLRRLLVGGRTTSSSFDLSPSPIAAFLATALGEAAVMGGVSEARKWWAGETSAHAYLAGQPKNAVVALARAAAEIVDTRAAELLALAEKLERA